MAANPVFQDTETPLDQLLSEALASPWHARAEEVTLVQAGKAIEGENFKPQLTPYAEWKTNKAKGEETPYDPRNTRAGKWGRIKCIDDNERERLVAIGLENARKLAEQREHEKEEERAHLTGSLTSRVFAVKESADGYILAKVDLRQYAEQTGSECDLVVVLPNDIDGVPVVRIDTEAFSRYNARGIGVRLLIIPDTVCAIDTNAFSFLAAETIYVGAGCTEFGGQALEKRILKPTIESRHFIISPDNPSWQSIDGSVLSKDGKELAVLAPPYSKKVLLPESVKRIDRDAFADWGTVPDVVQCGYTLEHLASKLWDSALWLCPQDAPLFSVLSERGVRLASPAAVKTGDCWYDFEGDRALLVLGPPAPLSASQAFVNTLAKHQDANPDEVDTSAPKPTQEVPSHIALSVPREIEGKAVRRVAPRALIDGSETLSFPEGLESIGYDNACKKTKHLYLPRSLKRIEAHSFCSRKLDAPTSIPESVFSIGEGCFEYCICRLEHTGSIVHISANQLLNCFIERTEEEAARLGNNPADYVPFDFERYDTLLREGRSLPDRLGALIHRIGTPFHLDGATRTSIVTQLKANEQEAMEYVAREGQVDTVIQLLEAGFINEANFDAQIELLRRCNRTDCVLMLMDRHRQSQSESASVRSRFSL